MEAILFDLDGTLVDHKTAEARAAILLHSQYKLGNSVLAGDFLRKWHQDLEDIYPRYTSGEITFEEQRILRVQATWRAMGMDLGPQPALAIFHDYLRHYEKAWKAFPDIYSCLESLSSFKLGIITYGNKPQQYKKLRQCNLERYFEVIVISEDVGFAKPEAGIFHLACQQIGVKPSDALYIGDRWDLDVVGAVGAGLKGVWLNREQAICPAPDPSVIILKDLTDIMARFGVCAPTR